MTNELLRSDFHVSFPHDLECFVHRYAHMLVGVDRRGKCQCGAEQKEHEFELALIGLREACDGCGLKVRLGGGRLDDVARDFNAIAEWFIGEKSFVDGPDGRIAALRNLELLARVYRLMLQALPRHTHGCSNQNPVDPLGAWRGAHECGCNTHGAT